MKRSILLLTLCFLSTVFSQEQQLGGVIENMKNGFQIFTVCDVFSKSDVCQEFSFYEVPGDSILVEGYRINKNSLRFQDVQNMFQENKVEPQLGAPMFSKTPKFLSWSATHAKWADESGVLGPWVFPLLGTPYVAAFIGDVFIKGPGILIGELCRKGFGDLSARIKAQNENLSLKRNVKFVEHTLKNTSKIKRVTDKRYGRLKGFIKGY